MVAKVPEGVREEVSAEYWKIFNDIKADPGAAAVAVAEARAQAFADKYGKAYPKAVECLLDGFSSLTVPLRFPREHWERIRHTNLIERTFGEAKRRTKVIGRLPGETSCLSLVWAVLDRASQGWRGVDTSVEGIRLLQDLRRLLQPIPSLADVG